MKIQILAGDMLAEALCIPEDKKGDPIRIIEDAPAVPRVGEMISLDVMCNDCNKLHRLVTEVVEVTHNYFKLTAPEIVVTVDEPIQFGEMEVIAIHSSEDKPGRN